MALRFSPNGSVGAIAIVTQQVLSQREATTEWTTVSSATYTVTSSDRRLWVTVNPCTITFPLASTITYDVLIKDAAGTAFTNNINTAYTGGQTCDGSANVKITTDYGSVIIGPNPTDTGYTTTG